MEINPLQAAVDGLTAHQVRLATAAGNIANANSSRFQKYQSVIDTDGDGRPRATVSRPFSSFLPQTGALGESDDTGSSSNVDLPEEFVRMKIAEYGFKANVTMLHAQDEMIGTIIDIIA